MYSASSALSAGGEFSSIPSFAQLGDFWTVTRIL